MAAEGRSIEIAAPRQPRASARIACVAAAHSRRGVARGRALRVLAAGSGPEGLRADEIDYNWHVRPILSENCFKCHGPDPSAREAGLRLDLGELAIGRAAGDAGQVRDRARRRRPQRARPPHHLDRRRRAHAAGVDAQDAVARSRSRSSSSGSSNGARVPAALGVHRAERPAVPTTAFAGSAPRTTSIASCSSASSAKAWRRPRQADKETLINRVTLTLTGLPPTLEEVDAFVADAAPDAYERLVDRLLASPAYGEHMARLLARPRALQRDRRLPRRPSRPPAVAVARLGHRGVRPQHAVRPSSAPGSSPATCCRTRRSEQMLATAFLRVGKRTTENGAIDEEYRAEYMVERTDNALGTAFLGLTVGCARCHDHKYDPIKQNDYYSLGAFFNSTDEPGSTRRASAAFKAARRCRGPTTRRRRSSRSRPPRVAATRGRTTTLRALPRPTRRDAAAARRSRPAAPRRGRDTRSRSARRRARRALRVRVRDGPRRSRTCRRRVPPRHSARDADRVPAQPVLAAARRRRANETAEQRRQREQCALLGARAAQLQRRVADAVAGRDAAASRRP